MKFLKVFIAIVFMTSTVNSLYVSNGLNSVDFTQIENAYNELYEVIDEELIKTRGLISLVENEEDRKAVEEAIQDFESLKLIKMPVEIVVETHSRRKRQASDCDSLKTQLATVDSQIISIQESITNFTTLIAFYEEKSAYYLARYQNTSRTLDLSFYNSFTSVKNSTINALNKEQAALVELQSQKATLEAQISVSCATTTEPPTTTTEPPTPTTEPPSTTTEPPTTTTEPPTTTTEPPITTTEPPTTTTEPPTTTTEPLTTTTEPLTTTTEPWITEPGTTTTELPTTTTEPPTTSTTPSCCAESTSFIENFRANMQKINAFLQSLIW